jgi:hypothetical protein
MFTNHDSGHAVSFSINFVSQQENMADDIALGFMALDDSILAGTFDDATTGYTPSRGYSTVPAASEGRGSSNLSGLSNQCEFFRCTFFLRLSVSNCSYI